MYNYFVQEINDQTGRTDDEITSILTKPINVCFAEIEVFDVSRTGDDWFETLILCEINILLRAELSYPKIG